MGLKLLKNSGEHVDVMFLHRSWYLRTVCSNSEIRSSAFWYLVSEIDSF